MDLRMTARRTLAGPTKQAWRAVGARLPAQVADGLATRSKRALRRAGLSGIPRPSGRPVASQGSPVAECNICGTVVPTFLPYGTSSRPPAPDRKCPTCGSLPRHRAVWLYLQQHTSLFSEPVKMLHIAPERFLADRLKKHPDIDYVSADLQQGRAMVVMDITDIDQPDDTYDVIYASHVLEHIPDDVKAMRELHRVLRPGGWAMLQVPIWGDKTLEDDTVTDEKERERLFGQWDHVRMYGHDGEYERRLRLAGFQVDVKRFVPGLDRPVVERLRLKEHEDIYLCSKVAVAGPS